jgi:hypothetical protein
VPVNLDDYDVLEVDPHRLTDAGWCAYVRIHRLDMEKMGYRELWSVVQQLYPGKWAVQSFPPWDKLIDQANKYHVLVFERTPEGFDLWP